MAEEKKYTKEELARLEELKRLATEEYALKKDKRLEEIRRRSELLTKRDIKKAEELGYFIDDFTDREEPIRTDTSTSTGTGTSTGGGGGGVEPVRDPVTGKALTVSQVVETDRIREVREMPAVTPPVYFTLDYNIEPIPRPDLNKVHGLYVITKNVSDKQYYAVNDDNGNLEVIHRFKNFVGQNGSNIRVRVNASVGTSYKLVVHNETDNTYYNTQPINGTIGFRTGFSTIDGTIQKAEKFVQGKDPEDKGVKHDRTVDTVVSNTRDKSTFNDLVNTSNGVVMFVIPPSTTEKIFKISLLQESFNTYDDYVPIYNKLECPPIKITQLPNPTTTIKFDDEEFGYFDRTGDLEITHIPGANLNHNIYTNGIYDIDVSIKSILHRKTLSLNDSVVGGIVHAHHLANATAGPNDPYTYVDILDTDLIATVTNNTGSIKGTITIGKSCYKSCNVLIKPSNIFTLS